MNTKCLQILLFTISLACVNSLFAKVHQEPSPEIARVLSDVEKLLPEKVQYPRALMSALSGYGSSPTPAGGEKIAELVSEMLGDMEARG